MHETDEIIIAYGFKNMQDAFTITNFLHSAYGNIYNIFKKDGCGFYKKSIIELIEHNIKYFGIVYHIYTPQDINTIIN